MALTVSGPTIPVNLVLNDQASRGLKAALGNISHSFRRTAILLASYNIYERIFQRLTANVMEFEEGMATVSTFVDTGRVSLEKLKDEAILLRANTVFTFSQITDAMSEAIQRGVEINDIYSFLLQSSKAATAANADLTEIVNVTTSAWAAYGKELGTAAKIQDAFFATQDIGNLKIADIATELGRVFPIAQLAGVAFEEVLAGVAAITRSGLPVSESVTRMARVLTVVSKASDRTRKEFAKLGVDFSAAGVKAKGLQGFIMHLMEATGGNADVLARLIPEIRSFQGVAILGGKASEIYAQALEKIQVSAGRTETEHKKRMDSVVMQWKRFQGVISAVSVEFGRAAVPAIKRGLEQVTGQLMMWFLENREKIKARGREWGVTLGRIFGLLARTLSVAWQVAAPVFFNFTRGLLVLSFAFQGIETAIKATAAGSMIALSGMMKAWNQVAVWLNNAREFVGELTDGALGGDKLVPEIARGTISEIEAIGKSLGRDVFGKMKTRLEETLKEIRKMTEEGGIFGEGMTRKAKEQASTLLGVLDAFMQGVEDSFSQAGSRQIGFWDGMKRGFGDFMADVEDHFEEGVKAANSFVKGLTNSFQELFFSPFDENIKSAKQAFEEFGRSILRTFGAVLSEVLARQAVYGILKLAGFAATPGPNPGQARGFASNWVKTGNKLMHAMGQTRAVLGHARGHYGVLTRPEVVVRGEGTKAEAVIPMPDNRSVPVKFTNPQATPRDSGSMALLLAPDVVIDRGLRASSQLVRRVQALPFQIRDVEQYRILRGTR